MRLIVTTLALFLGCRPAPPPAAVDARADHPPLDCPAGTHPTGSAPPMGLEAWCERQLPDGSRLREGPSTTWHANRQIAASGTFVTGKRTGPWEFYFPNGQVERRGLYVGGVEEGLWTTFHPDGSKKSEGEMVDGREHGPWTYWDLDGSSITGRWNLGRREGVWVIHDAEGQPVAERVYENGRLVGMRGL